MNISTKNEIIYRIEEAMNKRYQKSAMLSEISESKELKNGDKSADTNNGNNIIYNNSGC